MGDVFKPWRQKVGGMALAVTCAFAVGWVRSLTIFSQVVFPLATHTYVSIVSHGQSFRIVWERDAVESSSWSDMNIYSMPINDVEPVEMSSVNPENLCLNMPFRLRRKANWVHPSTYSIRTACIPYWCLVIPLTLPSAYLLLSKCHPAKPASTL